MKYIFQFLQMDKNGFKKFRYNDLISVFSILGINYDLLKPEPQFLKELDHNPFAIIQLNSCDDDIVREFLSLSVSVKKIYELLNTSGSISELLETVPDNKKDVLFSDRKSFSFNVEYANRSIKNAERLALISRCIRELSIKGSVDLKNPGRKFFLLSFTKPQQHENVFYLGRKIGSYNKRSLTNLALNKRPYIGPTSTDVRLSMLMLNQALAREDSLVYDPFCGTGSILLSAAFRKAVPFGSDINISILRGDKDANHNNVCTNFKHYGLSPPELLRIDNSKAQWRFQGVFDAIVCDPPYGIRAGAKKGLRDFDVDLTQILSVSKPHFPKTEGYAVGDLIWDLQKMAAFLLKKKGRLVYLQKRSYSQYGVVPTAEDELRKGIHPCFKFVAQSEQTLCSKYGRVLISLERK